MTGTAGQRRVPSSFLEACALPLPPLPEQHRIVEAIENYFTRLDDAVATLERVQRNLKRYRASMLKAAVEGRLVPTEAELARAEGRDYEPASVLLERILTARRRRWQEAGSRGKYHEHGAPEMRSLTKLPEGWRWVRLDGVCDVQLGQQRAPVHTAAEIQHPYVRAANITWSGLDLSDVKSMGFPDRERYRLKYGDVLLSEASGSPMEAGKPAVWKEQIPGACYQKTLLRVRALDPNRLLPEYLRLVFLRDCLTGKFAKLAPGVGIVHITAERLVAWAVPLPPTTEQRRIVVETERVESILSRLSSSATEQIARLARLRQAILKWAFEGKLADQDPADEPASVLLERIRSEREATPPTRAKTRVQAGRPRRRARARR
jgi:type I restriction enzyme S subunit